MAKFLSGPPGGRTLPHTPTRLSDLVGGVYGPGASVASTGLNTQRPAVKAGMAMAAGETWADVLEYHLVSTSFSRQIRTFGLRTCSSTPTVVRLISLIDLERYSTKGVSTLLMGA